MATPETKPADPTAPVLPKQRFVHLHTHSHYSLLNALPQIPALVKAAKKKGVTGRRARLAETLSKLRKKKA